MTIAQIERMISRLPKASQADLVRRLEAKTWRTRFAGVIGRIRRQAGRVPDVEITRIVEEVRQAQHASGGR